MLVKKSGGEAIVRRTEDGHIHFQIEHDGELVAGVALKPETARQLGIDLIKAAEEAKMARDQAPNEEGDDYGRIG